MKGFDYIVDSIKKVRIQGANDVATAGINAYNLRNDPNSISKLLHTRPTEPLLQNSIRILQKALDKKKVSKMLLLYIKNSNKKIPEFGADLIKKDMNIFTHCHSSTVVNILKKARRQKNFVVYNTETHPLLQGRKTAQELAKARIKVVHLPDTAVEYSLKKCDLFLFGADAFLKKGVVNKIGTKTYCQIAKLYNIPAYSCGISLKFAKKIKLESRPAKEVWSERQKNIKVLNPAFDLIEKKYVTGVISEFGTFPYEKFIKKAKENLKNFEKNVENIY